ncbi:hypothetical protein [Pseudonocardia zijingensis]|jgi:hypothetical protein|uniref:Uncharacterized protein n=1 Tax=Pseudonocardia zijingensis TaxID=153376 RepID=A0ABN1NHR4_9PSEU
MTGGRWKRDATPRVALVWLWGAATLLGLAVAAMTRIGPVLLTVSGSHGVHVGDLIGFTVAYGGALVGTRRVLARARPDGLAPVLRMRPRRTRW